jgi:hypothetical protein
VAVENDYDLLAFNLTNLADMVNRVRAEVENRREQERGDRLGPNETGWLNRLAVELQLVESTAANLRDGAWIVLRSPPGEAVYEHRPPPAPGARP